MNCECDFENIVFGKDSYYCKKCGMDLGLNPLKIKHKSSIQFFCCEGCVN